ncbi:MAG: hypothetical protein KDA79_06765 [Planctomycetaceae bacterium]|nr:hypothetical protein [Planctomycetaceae bacterium]
MSLSIPCTRPLPGPPSVEQTAETPLSGRWPAVGRSATEGTPAEQAAPARAFCWSWRSGAVVLLHLLEQLLWLIRPLMLGVAINGLVQSSWFGLMLFAGAQVLYLLAGSAQRVFSTRLLIGLETMENRHPATVHAASGGKSTRRQLEQDIPQVVRLTCGTAGTLVLLAWYDILLVPWCLAFLLPAWLLSAAFAGASQAENIPDDSTETTLRKVARRIRQADAAAARFSLTELFGLGVLAGALVQYCFACRFDNGPSIAAPLAGDVLAVVSYLLLYLTCAAEVPAAARRLRSSGPPSLQSRSAARSAHAP